MARPIIGIDARLYGAKDRGIGRYCEELVFALSDHLAKLEIILFVRPGNTDEEELRGKGFTIVHAPFRAYSWQEQILFPKCIASANVQLMHFPHFNVPYLYRGAFVVTIHDLILHHFPSRQASTLPSLLYWGKYWVYRLVFRLTITRARLIIAVSEYTHEDLGELFPATRSKIIVVHEPISAFTSSSHNDKNVKLSYTGNKPYVLVVGAFYPHKNISRLLRVWSQLETEYTLILCGPADAFATKEIARAEQLGLLKPDHERVRFVQATDEQLCSLYQGAAFVLVPSLFEGVGLPGLEALAVGKSVVSSACSSMPEMYESNATYIPVSDDEQMLVALQSVCSNPEQLIVPKNIEPRMTTEQLGKKIVRIYENLFGDANVHNVKK